MKSKTLLFALFILSALLLSACKINFVTEFKDSESGTYVQEIGLPDEQLASFGMSADDFCDEMAEDMPAGMNMRKETRNEETWCIFESQFTSINELKRLYSETDTRVNQITTENDRFIYDIVLDMSGEDTDTMGFTINANWTVKMPGKVIEHNATEQNGNTLTWKLVIGKENEIRAVSELGGGLGSGMDFDFNFDGGPLVTGFVAVIFLCLCCVIPLIIGVVAFFLIRKKKTAGTGETPVEPQPIP